MSSTFQMRYGHAEGHTEVCFDASGSTILTSGYDGQIRIWKDIEKDQNPKSIKVGNRVYALALKDDVIYAGTDNNSVDKYAISDGSPEGILLRFTANATHIVLSESQNTVVAGASDFSVKMIDLTTSDQKVFTGHEAPILSVAADPLDEYLASVSCDGDLRIWDTTDCNCVEKVKMMKPSNDICNSESLSRMSWRPATGEDIAVPSGNEIKLLARGTWSLVHSFKTALTSKVFNCCTFSPCGRFLAAASVDGWVCVWDAETQDCLQTLQHSLRTNICGIVWDPRETNTLALADVRGQVGLLKDAVPSKTKSNQNSVPDDLDALFEDEDGDMNEFLDDAAAESDGDQDDLPALKKKKRQGNLITDDEDGDKNSLSQGSDFAIPSTNNLFADTEDLAPPTIPPTSKPILDLADDDASSSVSALLQDQPGETTEPLPVYSGPHPTAMQPAFQPGSTPSYLSHRFMVWNSIGTIRSYADDMETAIDVEFHDKQHHYALHLNNESQGGGVYNTMADLSMNAIALAAEVTEDTPSKLTCIHYASWEGNKEWSVEMPEEEDIKALTIGESWIAVCTDARLVRMFSLGGMQRLMFSIPGPVVSMSAHTDQLFIAYHVTQGFNNNQCLSFMLLEVCLGTGSNRPRKIVGGEPLPLSKKSSLQWIGFTAEGTPATVDTAGVVRLMNRGFANTWVPVSYLKKLTKSRHDSYWVVGLLENPKELRCILCKGSTYPATLPRPFPTIQSYKLPLCEPDSDKTKFEDEYWQTRLFSAHLDYLESRGFETDESHKESNKVILKQSIMKMFALACKTDRESRAYEICSLMPSSDSVNLAIKYASRMKRIVLAQKLTEVAQEKTQEEMEALMKMQSQQNQEEEEDDQEDFRAEMQAGYSQVNTEWTAHKKMLNAKKRRQREEDSDQEEMDEDEDVMVVQNGRKDSDFEDLNKKKKSMAKEQQPTIKLSGGSRNPFKKRGDVPSPMTSSQTSSPGNAPVGKSSVLDNIKSRPSVSQRLRGVIAKSHSLKKKPVATKDTKKQQTLFGATSNQKFHLTSTPKGKKQQMMANRAEGEEVEPSNVNKQILRDVKNEPTSGVQLYVSDVRQKISEENPDLDGVEVRKLAIQDFRKLSAEERKVWNERAKNSSGTSDTVTASGAKRKLKPEEDEKDENVPEVPDDGPPVNKIRKLDPTDTLIDGSTTNSKLAAFAFSGNS